jgi:hypothetical protein
VTRDRRGRKRQAKGKVVWKDAKSLSVRAMVLAEGRLAVAGPVDIGRKTSKGGLGFENESEARAAYEGEKGVFLRVVASADGKKVAEQKLSALPVFDGLSAAGGKLFLSLKNGSVVCLGE